MNQTFLDFNQKKELARVGGRIGQHVRDFLESKGIGGQFYASELYKYCESQIQFLAPGSSCRILRELRKNKLVEYDQERAKSRYTITRINF